MLWRSQVGVPATNALTGSTAGVGVGSRVEAEVDAGVEAEVGAVREVSEGRRSRKAVP